MTETTTHTDQGVTATVTWIQRPGSQEWFAQAVTLDVEDAANATVVARHTGDGEVIQVSQTLEDNGVEFTRALRFDVTSVTSSVPRPNFFYGSSVEISGLQARDVQSLPHDVTLTLDNDWAIFIVPASWGDIAVYVDGLDQTDGFATTPETVGGGPYVRFTSLYQLTGTITFTLQEAPT